MNLMNLQQDHQLLVEGRYESSWGVHVQLCHSEITMMLAGANNVVY